MMAWRLQLAVGIVSCGFGTDRLTIKNSEMKLKMEKHLI